MEFFNKKQDVLDLQLTGYGKHLLTLGIFNPVYYAFSDDGVLYDCKWMSGSLTGEQQSDIEERIQELTPRLKTQYRKVAANKGSVPYWTDQHPKWTVHGAWAGKGLVQPVAIETFKLLENLLGKKTYFNNFNPAWSALFYNGKMSDSTAYYKRDDITILIPQLNCEFTDNVYKVNSKLDPLEVIPEAQNIQLLLENSIASNEEPSLKDIEEQKEIDDSLEGELGEAMGLYDKIAEDSFFEQFDLDDGSILVVKDFIFLSLEEANSTYTDDNFMVEIFEVTTTNVNGDTKESLKKLIFEGWIGWPQVGEIFNIEFDAEINAQLACALIGKDKTLKDQSIYNTNLFDCAQIAKDATININPYDNLPEAIPEDVC